MNTRSSYVVFFLFSVFFGLSFSVPSGKTAMSRFDGASYRQKFEEYRLVSNLEFNDNFKEFLRFDEGAKDFYFETVAFFVSRFTDNYHVMFMIFALVFAFFSLKSLKILTSENNFNSSLACFILVFLFTYNSIFNINGVRFWTASWIAVYSVLQIFQKGNKKFYLLALSTPFFHASFWIFLIVILLAHFTKRFKKILILLFFVSFAVSSFSVEIARSIGDLLPPFLSRMVNYYTDTYYIAQRAESGSGLSWVSEFSSLLTKLYINYLVWLFIKNRALVTSNSKTSNLFSFLLFWMIFVNFTMPIPSMGNRFIVLSYPVIAYIWLVNFKGKKYQNVLYLLPIVFALNIYTHIFSYYLGVTDISFYISSPFILFYQYIIAY